MVPGSDPPTRRCHSARRPGRWQGGERRRSGPGPSPRPEGAARSPRPHGPGTLGAGCRPVARRPRSPAAPGRARGASRHPIRASAPRTRARRRRGRDQLAPHPGRGRADGHVQVDELPSGMAHESEHVQPAEGERLDRQQVGRPDPRSVDAEEPPQGLGRLARRSALVVPLDRGLADRDSQLPQLAADPLGAPAWIDSRRGGEQLTELGADPRPAWPAARPPAPVEPPAPTVQAAPDKPRLLGYSRRAQAGRVGAADR
jgi:hypothetical protein